ncbi:uncharacterized protein LOC108740277 isoform X1 [Agrilus planipennis]|uniref:Uncharacterized protein LOC108740277 isoform X1 n=1 Tax=Agrilus planipennis TaxID=224129 RepID=A0A7F5RIU8_AGRPL|nr:uncharacterized protein LOC108740277 isoform X1 [Agrilus planipennis]
MPCEESWKAKAEEYELEHRKSKESSPEELTRTEVRQSATKRVKKYFKRCKYALSKSNSGEASSSIDSYSSLSNIDKKAEESLQDVTVTDLTEIFEDVCVDTSITNDFSDKLVVANVIDVKVTTGVVPENSDYVNVRTDREPENLERVVSENLEPISERIQELFSESVETFEPEQSEVGSSESFPHLTEEQERVKDKEEVIDTGKSNPDNGIEAKCDVASLVDRYFGDIYWNFQKTRKCLVRQARDVLVCEYHGSLQKFEEEFCIPASKLLQQIKNKVLEAPFAPRGWPLSLGASGVLIHLGPLSATLIRNRDCYLCIRNRSAPGLELALVWRKSARIHCQTLAEFKDPFKTDGISAGTGDIINMCSTLSTPIDIENCALSLPDGPETELPELLQNLLVSVEHAIERVPLDDLVMPCPHCLMYLPLERQEDTPDGVTCSCQCSCFVQEGPLPSIVKKKDTSIQTSPMFEFAGSIPHIDSDEDDERDLDRNGSYNKKPVEIQTPKRITDLPEKLLMSGINLPAPLLRHRYVPILLMVS